jgi:hypothetical protein
MVSRRRRVGAMSGGKQTELFWISCKTSCIIHMRDLFAVADYYAISSLFGNVLKSVRISNNYKADLVVSMNASWPLVDRRRKRQPLTKATMNRICSRDLSLENPQIPFSFLVSTVFVLSARPMICTSLVPRTMVALAAVPPLVF